TFLTLSHMDDIQRRELETIEQREAMRHPTRHRITLALREPMTVTSSARCAGWRASHFGMPGVTLDCMSTQIAVRLPEEMVAFMDRRVATGEASSRAALVASAVEREMRRLAAVQDAQILRAQGTADELDDLVDWTGAHAVVED
ncbi:MAG: ribbon-helix-helix domain-containing protein, partial [Nostocoides sp.]